MKTYKYTTNTRFDKDFILYNSQTLKEIKKSDDIYKIIDPIKMKLFNQDIFKLEIVNNHETLTNLNNNNNDIIKILHSSTREIKYLSGVLDLSKKYGKYLKKNIYKVIPDDKRLPEFFVPYHNTRHSKIYTKKYITFKYNNWKGIIPFGFIVKIIGDTNRLASFYEYQLYCKSLYSSIQTFSKETLDRLKRETENEMIESIQKKYIIENRLNQSIISIDPQHCKDIDDAISYKYDENIETHIISIYISNVSIWMDYLDLWNSFANRVSTIYLPDRKRPMLPTLLSDNLCSLIQGHKRIAFTLDLYIKNDIIVDTKICNSLINVERNYFYKDKDLNFNINYQNIFNVISRIHFKYNYIDTIYDSHDLIAYLMVLMNKILADKLLEYKNGIFRTLKMNQEFEPSYLDIPRDMKKFLRSWNSSGGFYIKYSKTMNQSCHDLLKLDGYVHITSPIRRLADLLNIMQIQENMNLCQISENGLNFLEKWSSNEMIDYMNTTMRSVRKVQNSCLMIKSCLSNNELLNCLQPGYIFDKIVRNDGLYQYMVYLDNPKLKTCGRFTTRFNLDNYKKYYFNLYLFENCGKKKIMIGIENNKIIL